MPRPVDVQRASVLIADDDVLRAVMRATLEQSGFLVTGAADGADAVAGCAKVDCTGTTGPRPAGARDGSRQAASDPVQSAVQRDQVYPGLTGRRDRDGGGAFVVEDTGIGIAPEDLARAPDAGRPSRHTAVAQPRRPRPRPASYQTPDRAARLQVRAASTPGAGTVVTVRRPRT